jgi:hypothetical protein
LVWLGLVWFWFGSACVCLPFGWMIDGRAYYTYIYIHRYK